MLFLKYLGKSGELNFQIIDLEHDESVINLDIKQLKDKIGKLKNVLVHERFYIFKNKDGLVLFANIKSKKEGEVYQSGIWSIKVGNNKLDVNSLTFYSGGAVVGNIPAGLPSFEIPTIDVNILMKLIPIAIIISLLGFMEAISIAKAMAARTGQRLDPNQELIGQGIANIVGCFGRSYAVSGSFSRSAVNIQAGAVSGMSSVVSSIVVMITLLFFTSLLYHLPQAVLAAIIMMAVIGLLNVSGFIHAWKANKFDGVISVITFVATLFFAPHLDKGIMIGVVLSLGYYLYRGMKPNIALLAKHPDGTWRNSERFGLKQCKHIAVIRYNGSLFFANVSYLEKTILDVVSSMPELRHIIIVANGINELDASGEDMLSTLIDRLRGQGYEISLTGTNDHVMDTMKRTYLYYKIGENNMYRNVAKAMEAIHKKAHENTDEEVCPLLEVVHLTD
jgi:SulP family sulfate permease